MALVNSLRLSLAIIEGNSDFSGCAQMYLDKASLETRKYLYPFDCSSSPMSIAICCPILSGEVGRKCSYWVLTLFHFAQELQLFMADLSNFRISLIGRCDNCLFLIISCIVAFVPECA